MRGVVCLIFLLAMILSCGEKTCPFEFKEYGDFRVIAVGHRIFMEDAETYETYKKSFLRDVEKISACIDRGRTLLVFPEDSGLIGGLIGDKVKGARNPELDTLTAFTYIIGAYGNEMSYIHKVFPEVATNIGRVLTLALTHVVWKAFYETFSSIAKKYGVYVMSSVNSAIPERTYDKDVVSIFGDPDDEFVYFPSSSEVYNSAVLFSPEGEVIARVNKCYLVPEERDLLGMTHEDVRNLKPIELPFGKAGVVTSKDAWMVDVIDRLNILGARVLIQPEAYSGWTYDEYGGWGADKFMESAWASVQKFPMFLYSIVPIMVGNFFSMSFDGQTHIVKKSEPSDIPQGFVGSVYTTGFLTVQPWVIEDPILSNPAISNDERRRILDDVEKALAPHSGSPYENEYREYSAGIEITMAHPEPISQTEGLNSFIIYETHDFQRFPDIATSPDGFVYVVWSQMEGDVERVYMVKGKNTTFSSPVRVSPDNYSATFPSVAVLSSGRVAVSWEGLRDGVEDRDVFISLTDDMMNFSITSPVDGAYMRYDQWVPRICADGNILHAVWVDFRLGSEDVYYDSGINGENFGEDLHVDSTDVPRSDQQDNSYRPSLSCGNSSTLVIWTDFRNYSWDIYASIFPFSQDFIVNDSDLKFERLNTDPDVVSLPDGSYFAVWTDIRGVPPWQSVWGAKIDSDGTVHRNINISGNENPAWFPSVAVSPSGKIAVVWQELYHGENHIFMSISDDNGETFLGKIKVSTYGHSYTPRIKFLNERRVSIVWQGIKNNKGVIYYAETDI